jgi:hypothetical protein
VWGYNGFTAGTTDSYYDGHADITGLTADYQSGPLGDFYYPSSGSGDLFALVDHGSRTADVAGLSYYFTTQQDQTPDAGTVDIGYHYPIISAPVASTTDQQICPNNPFDLYGYDLNYPSLPVTYIVVTPPTHGTLGYDASGNFAYTPNSCYEGQDTFTYKVNNGYLDSAPDTVTFTMADPVTANPPPVQTCRDTTSAQFTLGGYENNGCGEELIYTKLSDPTHGYLTGTPGTATDPTYTYTPNDPNFTGTDTFTYKVNSECGDSSDTATVTITIGDPNPSPNCQDVMTGVNTPVTFTLSASEICSDPLTFAPVPGSGPSPGTLGTITPIDATHASVTYTPGSSTFEGVDGFDFTTSDGVFNSSSSHVTINVVSAPVLTTECRSDRIVLHWTVPDWLENQYGDGFFNDFRIYRCETSSGSCTPTTLYATVTDSSARTYVDTDVQPGMTYCYRVTFTHLDGCDGTTVYESPYSNESCISTCSAPSNGPTDVAFILDNTGSIWDNTDDGTMEPYQNAIIAALTDIETSSGGDYRFALVTPDTDGDMNPTNNQDFSYHDMVVVRIPFTSNVAAFEAALNDPNLAGDGGNTPESTDQCLNTAVNALVASGRQDVDNCAPPDKALQIGDFTPAFRSNARKLVVLITDAGPGGFCDNSYTTTDAHQYALDAKAQCIKINAIQISDDSNAQTVMQDYSATSCGWYEQLPYFSTSSDIEDAILNMIYMPGACDCQ